jgi:hypothetical protein
LFFSRLNAVRRRMLKFASECPFLSRLWSSPNVTSSDQWQLFSIAQCDRTAAAKSFPLRLRLMM